MNGNIFKTRLLATSVFAGVLGSMAVAPAIAQEDTEAEARQQTVQVTGSRIVKQDFVANSPIATVSSETFELTGTVNTEDVLNTLPQAVPGFDRTSNNPGGGYATANLRGIGSNRTLVLVDGKRFVPTTAGGVVDLNNIPPALVERVEVITGGASAVYGSDAVAGVVNFILKDDFEGLEANIGYESTLEYGDAQYWNADLTMGANFADGRGNVTMNLGYTNREAVFQGQRDFSTFALGDGADGLEPGGSSGVPAGHLFDSFTFSDGSTGQAIFTDGGGIRPWVNAGANSDRYNYAPVNYLQLPQERFNTTTVARYEITPEIEAYARFTGAFNQVPQQLAPTPAFTTITIGTDNPFLTPEAAAVLAQIDGAYGDPVDGMVMPYLGRRMLETGARASNDDFFAFQFQAGLRGEFGPGIGYDVFFQTGRTQDNNDLTGDISLSRFLQGVDATTDADGNIVCRDQSGGCVPVNIFGTNAISDEAADYISAGLSSKSEYNQTIFGASINGDTSSYFTLPGGGIGWAVGFEYREESYDFRPDDNLGTGNLLGFNSAPPLSGGFDVYDFFGEVYVPILEDAPFADILALEGAYRISDYSTSGQTETYKIGGEWAPVEDVRFRVLYNTAVRAPNISELFSAVSNGFPPATDPCSASQDPEGEGIAALCTATGVPNVGTYEQRNSQIEGLFGGNPDLQPEEAETLTAGVVWTPSYIPGLSASVDYYSIEIEDYITSLAGGVGGILGQCYLPANNPTQDPNNAFCQAVNRSALGEPLVSANLANAGSLETSGVDVAVSYETEFDAIPGTFGLSYAALFLDKWDFYAYEGADPVECAGNFGLVFCDDPIAKYKHNATLSWANGPFTAQFRWEHLNGVDDDDPETDYIVESLDAYDLFGLSGSWDINDNVKWTLGVDNLFDEEPPIIGDNQEQANTYPATYDPFGRTIYTSVKLRF
ncbi:TonB-dependent receptor domain-containing protein [Ponticaulis profundi]|uniref:TonB-dependent receptor domain-containing protein n=1 Tax=Ponticaulis profundi TaxID=2665222 RepID=A0ABW1S6M2_9PROT